jgi:hypothetical protein
MERSVVGMQSRELRTLNHVFASVFPLWGVQIRVRAISPRLEYYRRREGAILQVVNFE